MSAMTGLLVFTRSVEHFLPRIPQVLRAASKRVSRTLYIHLDLNPEVKNTYFPYNESIPFYNALISSVYISSANLCKGLDVKLLLAGLKNIDAPLKTQKLIDMLILEETGEKGEKEMLEKKYRDCMAPGGQVVMLAETETRPEEDANDIFNHVSQFSTERTYPNVVLGGTFDRPHSGHLTMLSKALLRCSERLVCGVATGPLLKRKTLKELIRPLEERMDGVVQLVEELDPSVKCEVVPIEDPYGPTAWDPNLDLIVVSSETKKGADAINKLREERGLKLLETYVVWLVYQRDNARKKENKVSSSSKRMRLLGTILKEPIPKPDIPSFPYVIGLTGGSASGKSSVANRLAGLGAAVVDCDKLGHESYLPGTACHKELVDAFGADIVGEDNHINRAALAAKAFTCKEKQQQLNDIVWPHIEKLMERSISQLADEGVAVVILDAAVLLQAGWDRICHQVWVCIVKRQTAVSRIMERDSKTTEEAERRLDSQMSPEEQVAKANVVFCTEWEEKYTQQQVEKAWEILNTKFVTKTSNTPAAITTTHTNNKNNNNAN